MINPPTCAIASTIKTPGMIGLWGKCPGKKLSLMVTFLTPMAYEPCSISKTLSTKRNGYRCGKSFMMASMSICIGKALPRPFGSDPGSGFASAACALGAIRDFLALFKEEVLFFLREETDEDATRALDRDAERADIMISFFMKAFDCGNIIYI